MATGLSLLFGAGLLIVPFADGLLAAVEGDLDQLSQLIDVFLDDLPNSLGAIEVSIAAADPARLYRAAHSLRSAAGTMGAEECSDPAAWVSSKSRECAKVPLTRAAAVGA